MTKGKAIALARDIGFSNWGFFEVDRLKVMPEVRAMCTSDKCNNYDRNWSCPPACGSLEATGQRINAYAWGIILQTTGEIEDSFDYEGMQAVETRHKANLLKYHEQMPKAEDHMPLSAGACTLCEKCTYPNNPCRHPEQMMSSMEAYGLMVSDVCKLAGVPYRYGDNTVTFTGCVLFNERKMP